jgi:hypothetical protein
MRGDKKGAGSGYLTYAVIGVVVALIAGYAIFSFILPVASTPNNNAATTKNFFLSLTDPATVPVGTTALYVTYSALQLSVSHNGSVSTQALPGSGTVNVLALQNSSIVLAAVNVPNGSKVTQIKVNISNAVITINGKNNTVVIGEETLTINITTNNSISGERNGLVDLVPSVTAIETVDKTVYVLTASVRAVITPPSVFAGQSSNVPSGGQQQPPQIGSHINFSSNVNLTKLFSSVTPTIKITTASITVNGNDTDFSMTVQNTGNSSVELNGVMISGSKKVYFPPPPVNLFFHMPPMILMLPIMPPSGLSLPQGEPLPPKMIITYPNGTVLNTTSFFTQPQSINQTFPPSTNVSNGSGVPPGMSGTFYLLDLAHTAYAISLNSSGALLNISGDTVAKTTTIPQPPQMNATGQTGPSNMTIPPGATIIQLPAGTTLYIQFPSGMPVPKLPTAPSSAETQDMIIGRMILSNGSLGFPPMSLNVSMGQQPNSVQGAQGTVTSQVNEGTSNAVTEGASNLSINIPVSAIPKGYMLAAGASVTLTLDGLLTLGPTPQLSANAASATQMIQPPFAVLISGDVYTINLLGKMGAHAETQITAS